MNLLVHHPFDYDSGRVDVAVDRTLASFLGVLPHRPAMAAIVNSVNQNLRSFAAIPRNPFIDLPGVVPIPPVADPAAAAIARDPPVDRGLQRMINRNTAVSLAVPGQNPVWAVSQSRISIAIFGVQCDPIPPNRLRDYPVRHRAYTRTLTEPVTAESCQTYRWGPGEKLMPYEECARPL